MAVRLQPFAKLCEFAVAPDVVGDAKATLARSKPFLPVVRAMGFPAALAAQNGLTPAMVTWDEIDVLFLGGSPECIPCRYVRPMDEQKQQRCPQCGRPGEWKLSEAASLAGRGRTTPPQRRPHGPGQLTQAIPGRRHDGLHQRGRDVRGPGPDINLPKAMRWQREIREQGVLWEPACTNTEGAEVA